MSADKNQTPDIAKLEAEGRAKISPMIIVPIFIISLLSGIALAFTNGATAERIREAMTKELNIALAEVIPGFDNKPGEEKDPASPVRKGDSKLAFYPAKKGTDLLGFAVESTVYSGYSGELGVIFGVDKDGKIIKAKVIVCTETPGLGDKAKKPEFLNQFEGKSLADFNFKVKKDGGQVEALTGATITSRAVGLAIENGLNTVKAKFENSATTPSEQVPSESETKSEAERYSTEKTDKSATDVKPVDETKPEVTK